MSHTCRNSTTISQQFMFSLVISCSDFLLCLEFSVSPNILSFFHSSWVFTQRRKRLALLWYVYLIWRLRLRRGGCFVKALRKHAMKHWTSLFMKVRGHVTTENFSSGLHFSVPSLLSPGRPPLFSSILVSDFFPVLGSPTPSLWITYANSVFLYYYKNN